MTKITIYTSGGAVDYILKDTTDNFKIELASAIESGSVRVETIEGSILFINPLNAVAIEIEDFEEDDTPPGVKS